MYRMAGALALLLSASLTAAYAQTAPADGKIAVVAAENFYGDIVEQIGGPHVAVTSILNNPDQDPHLFENTPATVRTIADAGIVVMNGAGYDSWMEKTVKAARRNRPVAVVDAAAVTGRKAGDNPHLWFAPQTMPAVARAIAAALVKADPAHAADYEARLAVTLDGLARIDARVAEMKAKHAGAAITATEPVFGPMTDALGLTNRNQRFQLAMMNETEPSARDIAAFENDLKNRRVKALLYNAQVSEKLATRMRSIAAKAKVPVVGVTETMPANVRFQDWVIGMLDALDKALSEPNS